MACDCHNERLAVIETKVTAIHADLGELKEVHKEALQIKGAVSGIIWAVGLAWAGLLGIGGLMIAVFIK